mgnify:CR=1 FL=1
MDAPCSRPLRAFFSSPCLHFSFFPPFLFSFLRMRRRRRCVRSMRALRYRCASSMTLSRSRARRSSSSRRADRCAAAPCPLPPLPLCRTARALHTPDSRQPLADRPPQSRSPHLRPHQPAGLLQPPPLCSSPSRSDTASPTQPSESTGALQWQPFLCLALACCRLLWKCFVTSANESTRPRRASRRATRS